MSPTRPPRPKAFRASKEVKRLARERIGTPPPARQEEARRRRPAKHKKKIWEEMME